MAKYFGPSVKNGKVGSSVFSIRNGVTIERQYQPNVFNPSTAGQVAARAKMKTLSQLAEVMSSVIAIPRKGLVSPRNTYMKLNYGAVTYSNDMAQVDLTSIKLTEGIESLPAVVASRGSSGVSVRMNERVLDVDKIVYALFRRNTDGTLYLVGSTVVSEAGENGDYPYTFTMSYGNQSFVAYAYGVRANSDKARAMFGNITVPTAEMIAQLVVNRTLLADDVTLTETVAAISSVSNASMAPAPEGEPSEDENRKKKK